MLQESSVGYSSVPQEDEELMVTTRTAKKTEINKCPTPKDCRYIAGALILTILVTIFNALVISLMIGTGTFSNNSHNKHPLVNINKTNIASNVTSIYGNLTSNVTFVNNNNNTNESTGYNKTNINGSKANTDFSVVNKTKENINVVTENIGIHGGGPPPSITLLDKGDESNKADNEDQLGVYVDSNTNKPIHSNTIKPIDSNTNLPKHVDDVTTISSLKVTNNLLPVIEDTKLKNASLDEININEKYSGIDDLLNEIYHINQPKPNTNDDQNWISSAAFDSSVTVAVLSTLAIVFGLIVVITGIVCLARTKFNRNRRRLNLQTVIMDLQERDKVVLLGSDDDDSDG